MEMEIRWRFGENKWHIACEKGTYEESLGLIFNCEWWIKVTTKTVVLDSGRLGLLIFQLSNNNNVNEYHVEVTGNIGKLILEDINFSLDSNQMCETFAVVENKVEKISLTYIYLKFTCTNAQEKYGLCQINELCQDLQAMLMEEHLSDVTVRCNSTTFKVHKNILCARSPVFKVMFASPMQESATNTVTLNDKDSEIVRSMIQFMYSGQIPIKSLSEASSLLDVAEEYQLKGLNNGLIKYLKAILSENNALQILELADMYSENLKKDVLKFIGYHFIAIKKMKEWEDLKKAKPSLALDVYSYNE